MLAVLVLVVIGAGPGINHAGRLCRAACDGAADDLLVVAEPQDDDEAALPPDVQTALLLSWAGLISTGVAVSMVESTLRRVPYTASTTLAPSPNLARPLDSRRG